MKLKYKIEPVNVSNTKISKAIDAFLMDSNCATIFHTTEWNRIASEQFGTELLYFMALNRQTIVGALPCHFVRNGRFTLIAYCPPRIFEVSYGGPVAIGTKAEEISKALVKSVVRSRLNTFVNIFNSPLNTEWTNKSGIKNIKSFDTAYVDLKPSLNLIWSSSINGKKRNKIRKAQRENVEVKQCAISDLDIYYSIVQQMSQRTGIKIQPKSYYQAILQYFGTNDQARLYIAFNKGRALAGGIFLRYGPGCYYWVGATADSVPNLGQGELIQWQVIQWAKEAGCQWYDLVGIERDRLPQIARFKLGFTNDMRKFHYVTIGTIPGRLIRRIENLFARKTRKV